MTSTEPRTPSLAQRHRELRNEQIRAEIIDAAIAEFALKGFHEASLADIAKRLGTGPSTIYNYFDSKRAILLEVVETTTVTLLTSLMSSASEAPGDAEGFREAAVRFGDSLSDLAVEKPEMLRLMAAAMSSPDPEVREQWLVPLRAAVTLVDDYLTAGVDAGVLRSGLDTTATATAITSIPFGILLTQPEGEPEAVFGHAMVRAVVGMVAHGITRPTAIDPQEEQTHD